MVSEIVKRVKRNMFDEFDEVVKQKTSLTNYLVKLCVCVKNYIEKYKIVTL